MWKNIFLGRLGGDHSIGPSFFFLLSIFHVFHFRLLFQFPFHVFPFVFPVSIFYSIIFLFFVFLLKNVSSFFMLFLFFLFSSAQNLWVHFRIPWEKCTFWAGFICFVLARRSLYHVEWCTFWWWSGWESFLVGGGWVKSYLRTRIARLVPSMRRLTHLSLVSSLFSSPSHFW